MLYMIVYVENPHPHYDLIWCQRAMLLNLKVDGVFHYSYLKSHYDHTETSKKFFKALNWG